MKIRSILILIPLLIVGCTYYHRAFQKDSQFYTDHELAMVAETTKALTFGYGYDAEIELDYIFTYPYSKQDFDKKQKVLHAVVAQYEKDDVVSFYEKILYLRYLTQGNMEQYKKNQQWTQHTYVREYLLPPLQEYLAALESVVLSLVPKYREKIEERKVSLLDKAQKEISYLQELRKRRNDRKALNGRATR